MFENLKIPSLKKEPVSKFVTDYLSVVFHLPHLGKQERYYLLYLCHLFIWIPNKIFPQSTTFNSITLENIISNALLSFSH